MQKLTVAPQRLVERGVECKNKADEMENTIQAMSNLMREISGEWLGEASQSFQDQYADLLPGFNNMQNLVLQLSEQLKQIGNNYAELEATTAGQLGSR